MLYFTAMAKICLRGGKEHRALKLSQIVHHHDPAHYVYTENGSKNRSGSFHQLRVESKSVPVFPYAEAGVHCHVAILDKYISKLPPFASEKDVFYLKSLGTYVVSHPSKPWYASQACGENKLSGMVKSMFPMIGVSGKTNHSLRATSELFQAGVPEKMVQERTGHRSVKVLRMYERTTTSQYMAVSNVLGAPTVVGFEPSHSKAPVEPNTGGGFNFSSVFGSTTNYVINISMSNST